MRKGGLGIVWLAFDSELHREVALKEIKPRFADDPNSRHRFILEAEVTGGLEHPGIVPVYSLGRNSKGRPYYAMRFIRGEEFGDAIRRFHSQSSSEQPEPRPASAPEPEAEPSGWLSMFKGGAERFSSLAFRELLGRFLDVCDAFLMHMNVEFCTAISNQATSCLARTVKPSCSIGVLRDSCGCTRKHTSTTRFAAIRLMVTAAGPLLDRRLGRRDI
jgi:serine/threonine protein kinase